MRNIYRGRIEDNKRRWRTRRKGGKGRGKVEGGKEERKTEENYR